MVFRQFKSTAACVRSFMFAQNVRPRISEFWPIFTFLLKQQIKFASNVSSFGRIESLLGSKRASTT